MRIDFTQKTKDLLAKRVSFKCSNPTCRKPTIGPNTSQGQTISLGVAAHVTAASVGGPRFSSHLTDEERNEIENGIWLCSNCSILIDRDISKHSVDLLEEWKKDAEDEAYKAIQSGNYNPPQSVERIRPYTECELIIVASSKLPKGASAKTTEIYGDTPIGLGQIIWYNRLIWNYTLRIFNNSSVALFNLKVSQHPDNQSFKIIDTLGTVNNLPPLQDLSLRAEISKDFEGTGGEAMAMIAPQYPPDIQGLRLLFQYQGDMQKFYFTEVVLRGNLLETKHLDSLPPDYNI